MYEKEHEQFDLSYDFSSVESHLQLISTTGEGSLTAAHSLRVNYYYIAIN